MEEQRGGLAGLRLMGLHGSLSKPDVHAASLPSFLEDRLQGRQGCAPQCLAWLLSVGACVAEGSWGWALGGWASLMEEVRVGAVSLMGRMQAGRKYEAFCRGGREVLWSFK